MFEIRGNRFFLNDQYLFLQGVNLFLDPYSLEKDPRRIYTPHLARTEIVPKIIAKLKESAINCVRLWPTIQKGQHCMNIPDELLVLFAEANLGIVLNLPVNWNLKPSLQELTTFLTRYHPKKYPNILMYCIANELYHGMVMPHNYIDAVQHLTHRLTGRYTLVTNANLNFPFYNRSDVIGADFFTYRYSISRDGAIDVGSVAQMFIEDAAQVYKWFPPWILQNYWLVRRYLSKKALKNNYDPKYFQKNIRKVLKIAESVQKPLIVSEYGYMEDPRLLEQIFAYMPIKYMEGHIWYNWTNFDPNLDGIIENQELYTKFLEICNRLKRIKNAKKGG